MRLTLRTLLAYLDDTLEPAEAKLIGQKVAESDTAQELIARIKEVTRRRRITTPPDDSKLDPNTIAEYLDNELTAEALAEVEQVALASDVHLAELASCHQILTVVLGEPAVVPPSAYKRMYSLVRPPESNPRHQPPKRHEAEDVLSEGKEVDETLRLGMPALHRGSWRNRLILIGGTLCAVLLLGVALWQVWPSRPTKSDADAGARARVDTPPVALPEPGVGEKTEKKETETPPKLTPEKKEPEKQPELKKEPDEVKPDVKPKPPEDKPKKAAETGPMPPDPEVQAVGVFEPGQQRDPAVLLQLLPDKKQPERRAWTRLMRTNDPASSEVLSNYPLVSLPGYRSVVQMASGVRLTLCGNVPEFTFTPFPNESSVLLHPNDSFDLDLTLLRGRVLLGSTKDQRLNVRLRFSNPSNPEKGEIWDIALLEKGTEVIVNLIGTIPPGEPFFPKKDDPARLGPNAGLVMLVQSGGAELKLDLQAAEKLVPPPNGTLLSWDNRIGRPNRTPVKTIPFWLQHLPPLPKELKEADAKSLSAARATALSALEALGSDLNGPSVEAGLVNAMKTNDMQKRKLAVRAAGALDDVRRLIDTIEDKEPEIRFEAVQALRNWIAAERDNDYKLFEQLQPQYSAADATVIMEMLHGFAPQDLAAPATLELLLSRLTHKKLAIREMAYQNLLALFPNGRSINYNPTAADAQLRQAAAEWEKLVRKGKLK